MRREDEVLIEFLLCSINRGLAYTRTYQNYIYDNVVSIPGMGI